MYVYIIYVKIYEKMSSGGLEVSLSIALLLLNHTHLNNKTFMTTKQ